MTPKETAAAMREMADVIERMPPESNWYVSTLAWPEKTDDFRAIARSLGAFEKAIELMTYEITRQFGDGHAKIRAVISRSKICKKVRVVKEVEEFVCEDPLLDPLAVPQIFEEPISIFPK